MGTSVMREVAGEYSSDGVHGRVPHINDRVRLREGVPGTALSRGQVGVVCSKWACSKPTFEVEFVSPSHVEGSRDEVSRRLLTLEQIEVAAEA